MSQHGGRRPGAGRPPGSRTKTTRLDQQNMILRAQDYAEMALETLAEIAKEGSSERNRLAAAAHILDRAFGKPVQMQLIQDPEADQEALNFAKELRSVMTGSSPFPIATQVNRNKETFDGD